MRKIITIEQEVEIEISDDNLEQILKGFREVVDSTATVEDLFSHIAWNKINGGSFCEGVGEAGKEFLAGIKPTEIINIIDL